MDPDGDIITNRFSKLLSDKLNAKEINIALGGGSNERTLRTTYEWIRKNSEKVESTLFIIGFTFQIRKDLYFDVTKEWIRWSGRTVSALGDGDVKTFIGFEKEVDKWSDTQYKYFYNDDIEAEKLYRDFELLKTYIESKKSKLIVFNALRPGTKLDDRLTWYKPGGFKDWKTFIHSYREYDGSHPLVEDNQKLTEDFWSYLNE